MISEREMLTVRDVQRILNCNLMSVYQWIWMGKLKAIKVGKQWLVHPNHAEEFARDCDKALRFRNPRYLESLKKRGMA